MNLGFSKKTYATILLLLSSLFISLMLSGIPFFIYLQNKGYYTKIINDHTQYNIGTSAGYGTLEGLADISANNMIYSIINDPASTATPFRQLVTIRDIVQISNYPSNQRNDIMTILDTSGNTDNTKVSNLTQYIKNYSST